MVVSKNYLRCLIMLAPFFLSATIFSQMYSAYSNIILVLKLLVFLYLIATVIKRKTVSALTASVGLYLAIWLMSSVLNGQSLLEFIKESVSLLAFVFIVEQSAQETNTQQLVYAMTDVLYLELAINLVVLIFLPNGLWQTVSLYGETATYSFLGLDNQTTPIFIVAELLLFLRILCFNEGLKGFNIIRAIILGGNVLLTGSSTGIIGCVLALVVLLIGIKKPKLFNIKTVGITVAAIFVLIVFLRAQNLFAFIIENVFKKDLTLTNRIGIWDAAIELIKDKLWIGYGCGTMEAMIRDRNAHDFYLQIMLQSGIIGFTIYLNMIRTSLMECWKRRDGLPSLIIAACLGGYFVCCISEVYSQAWLMLLLVFSYYAYDIVGGN